MKNVNYIYNELHKALADNHKPYYSWYCYGIAPSYLYAESVL